MSEGSFIKRFTADELRARIARGESQTDHEYLRNLTEAELEASIANDPDWKDIPPNWHEGAEVVTPGPKKLLSLRLDQEVVDWFRATGPGYQTRMNAALRAYVRARQKARQP
jgi:uncharacterized protein (DUF4415 family)